MKCLLICPSSVRVWIESSFINIMATTHTHTVKRCVDRISRSGFTGAVEFKWSTLSIFQFQVDATLFAVLAQIVYSPYDLPQKTVIETEFTNLKEYCDRMKGLLIQLFSCLLFMVLLIKSPLRKSLNSVTQNSKPSHVTREERQKHVSVTRL